jgi:hypothetical protein
MSPDFDRSHDLLLEMIAHLLRKLLENLKSFISNDPGKGPDKS